MAVHALQRSADSIIPIITCPQCGKHMRLATVEPEGSDDHDRMRFDCECGFDYRLSDRARKGG
jgi:RNase P subunit RPR2